MKRLMLLIGLILLIFVLGACKSDPNVDSAQAALQDIQETQIPDGATPLAMQLALGTFQLEGTDLAITTEQAPELLPLWKAALSLSQSDNVAAEELEAVFEQIQETLSEKQADAITTMELSFEDMASIAEQYNLDLGRGGGFGFEDMPLRCRPQPRQHVNLESFQVLEAALGKAVAQDLGRAVDPNLVVGFSREKLPRASILKPCKPRLPSAAEV